MQARRLKNVLETLIMSDRTNHLTIALSKEIRVDDAQQIIDAIKMIKGVLTVEANVSNPDYFVAEARVRADIWQKLFEVMKKER